MQDKQNGAGFTHINAENQPAMVDISSKKDNEREAKAEAIIEVGEQVMKLLENGDIQSKKGPVFQTAIIAGTMAAKKTAELIPFCHPVPIEKCNIQITPQNATEIRITVQCKMTGKTGIEMEALTAANVAALTIYDMCKAVSKNMVIKNCRLLEKTGGKSDFNRSLEL